MPLGAGMEVVIVVEGGDGGGGGGGARVIHGKQPNRLPFPFHPSCVCQYILYANQSLCVCVCVCVCVRARAWTCICTSIYVA